MNDLLKKAALTFNYDGKAEQLEFTTFFPLFDNYQGCVCKILERPVMKRLLQQATLRKTQPALHTLVFNEQKTVLRMNFDLIFTVPWHQLIYISLFIIFF